MTTVAGHQESAPSPGKRFDAGKAPLDMIPTYPLFALARVYEYGARKYARDNWRGGTQWCRVFACVLRHGFRWLAGEDTDPESGLPHLAHAAFSIFQLLEYSKTHPEMDDRPKEVAQPV